MKIILLPLLLAAIAAYSQQPKAKTIIIKGVTFSEVCNNLLDKGYFIDKKDDALQTARTDPKGYPKHSAAYVVNVRVKDSIAYLTATFTAPYDQFLTPSARKIDPLWNNEPAFYHVNKSGKPKSLAGIAFAKIQEFALSLRKTVEYSL